MLAVVCRAWAWIGGGERGCSLTSRALSVFEHRAVMGGLHGSGEGDVEVLGYTRPFGVAVGEGMQIKSFSPVGS